MLKFYLDTCIVWWLIFIAEGLLFKDAYIKNDKKLAKYLGTYTGKRRSVANTILVYWFTCMIPIIRLLIFIIKLVITFNVDGLIKIMEEEKRNKNE